MPRAFFGVELDPPARSAAARVARELGAGARGVRWVAEETYHVTLRFLGQIAPASVPGLVAAVGRALCDQPGFRLRLGAPRLFPNPRRPRVVVLDLEPPDPLRCLAARVEEAVVGTGLPPEERPFRAHLTLGRVRGRARLVSPAVAAPGVEFLVAEVVLFESHLERDGARYTPLERIALGGTVSPDLPICKGEEHGKE